MQTIFHITPYVFTVNDHNELIHPCVKKLIVFKAAQDTQVGNGNWGNRFPSFIHTLPLPHYHRK